MMPMRFILLIAALSVSLLACANSSTPANDENPLPTVVTKFGQLSGVVEADSKVFRGIPYAQPPVGELRWQLPRQPTPWEGVRRAATFGSICPQKGASGTASEDCLTLNVAAPMAATSASKLPVLVWMHGGGFVSGSGSSDTYSAELWNANGIVLVTLNYRLGAMGFFAHPALDGENGVNYGLMDMVAALEWVQGNIEGFGGDTDRVTIGGLSAGAMAVNMLMVTPRAKGLFSGAIAHSGYGTWPLPRTQSKALSSEFSSAEFLAGKIVKRAMATESDNDVSRSELNAIGAEQFTNAIDGFHLPIVDGKTLSEESAILFARGQQRSVPFISGGSSYDGSVFPYAALSPESVLSLAGKQSNQVRDLWKSDYEISDSLGIRRFFGDMRYLFSGSYHTRQMIHVKQPGYLYLYDYVPPNKRGEWSGARHGSELYGLFNDITNEVAISMRRYWVNFIKTGNPNEKGQLIWPVVGDGHLEWMVFGDQGGVQKGVRQEKMDFLEAIYSERVSAIE